jgi:CDP-diacylglycerol--serine O-phosphatidyltransferase
MSGDFYWGPIMIMCSFIFDSLDGFAARTFKTTSDFGKELDSLCDIVSFGVAPAYLYSLAAPDSSNFTLDNIFSFDKALLCRIVPMVLIVAGAIRLAKFNTLPSLPYFKGLPIPANAIFFTGIIFGIQNESKVILELVDNPVTYIAIPLIFSFLMVNFRLRMFSSKGLKPELSKNIWHIILVIISIIAVIFFKVESMPIMVITYVILSILYHLTTKPMAVDIDD